MTVIDVPAKLSGRCESSPPATAAKPIPSTRTRSPWPHFTHPVCDAFTPIQS